MGESGQSRVIKFPYAPERPEQGDNVPLFTCSSTPHSISPRAPYETLVKVTRGLMCLCTYDLYSPVHNVLDA
jgi:hypothetical protein